MVNKQRYKGALLDAPYANLSDLLEDIYKQTDFPIWIIKKVIKLFFSSLEVRMMKGELIVITKFGAFLPYRRNVGLPNTHHFRKDLTKIAYKVRLSRKLQERIRDKTLQEVKDGSK